jgi:4-hydroxy-4-methyl-2-oxoglutarate aldolase
MNEPIIERLMRLDSCAISDALDSAGLPPAVVGLSPLTGRHKVAGTALTVRLGPKQPSGPSTRHLGTAAIDAAVGGEIIVVEHSSGVECAGWGGVLSAGAQIKGVRGVVIDGPARDIDEASELSFPVFGRYAIARTARGRVWEQAYNEPVTIGSVTVKPGDWVLADSSGIVFIQPAHLDDILIRAERIMRREGLMVEALRSGDRITDVVGRDYEDMLEKLD